MNRDEVLKIFNSLELKYNDNLQFFNRSFAYITTEQVIPRTHYRIINGAEFSGAFCIAVARKKLNEFKVFEQAMATGKVNEDFEELMQSRYGKDFRKLDYNLCLFQRLTEYMQSEQMLSTLALVRKEMK
jgi:hypothetical protein